MDGLCHAGLASNVRKRIKSYAAAAKVTTQSTSSRSRQLLKHAKLWYRFAEEYKPLKNTKPPAGQALTNEAQARLFEVAKSKPAWIFAYVAATLDFFCGLRACEI
jgi:hypothetical protein